MSKLFQKLLITFTGCTAFAWSVLVFSETGQEQRSESRRTIIEKIATDPKVDEQLFLIRKLEFLHSQLPTHLEDPKQVGVKLALVKKEMIRCEEHAKVKGMEPRLISMFTDSIKIADQFGELMVEIGAIERNTIIDLDRQGGEDIANSAMEGAKLGTAMAVLGFEPFTATVVGTGFLIKKAIENNANLRKLDEQKRFALEKRTNQFLNERSKLMGRIETQAGVIAEKLKWEPTEAGFDEDETESNKIIEARKKDDIPYFLTRAENLEKARPRDPFVFAESAEIFEILANKNQFVPERSDQAAEYRNKAAQSYLRAVQLIPKGAFHDTLRAEYIWKAGENASRGLYHTAGKSEFPILLADEALRIKPKDPSGKIRSLKAFALARNGEMAQALESYKSIVPVLGDLGNTYYDWACLFSLANKSDEAFEKLKIAWEKGYRHVREMRIDKDLETLRKDKGDDFEKLVQSNLSNGKIDYGFFWNNITFINNSGYPLNKVAIKSTWTGKDGAKYEEVYFAKKIEKGRGWEFEGVFDNASKSNYRGLNTSHISSDIQEVKALSPKDVQGQYKGIATRSNYQDTDVQETKRISIWVAPGQKTGLKIEINNADFVLEASDFSDGTGYASSNGKSIQIFFHEKIAYGWFQNPIDLKEGYLRAFWVER